MARTDGCTVDVNSAGSALAKAAAETGAMRPEIASQGGEKGHIRVIDRDRTFFRLTLRVSTIAISVLPLRGALPGTFNDLPDVLFLAVLLKAAAFSLPG